MEKKEIIYGVFLHLWVPPTDKRRVQTTSLQNSILVIHLTALERSMSSSARACPPEPSRLVPNSTIRRATCPFPPICCHLSGSPAVTVLLSHLKLASILHVIGWWDFLSGSWIQPSRSRSLLILFSTPQKNPSGALRKTYGVLLFKLSKLNCSVNENEKTRRPHML